MLQDRVHDDVPAISFPSLFQGRTCWVSNEPILHAQHVLHDSLARSACCTTSHSRRSYLVAGLRSYGRSRCGSTSCSTYYIVYKYRMCNVPCAAGFEPWSARSCCLGASTSTQQHLMHEPRSFRFELIKSGVNYASGAVVLNTPMRFTRPHNVDVLFALFDSTVINPLDDDFKGESQRKVSGARGCKMDDFRAQFLEGECSVVAAPGGVL